MKLNLGGKRRVVKVTDDNVKKLLGEFEKKVQSLKTKLNEEVKRSGEFRQEVKDKRAAYDKLVVDTESAEDAFDELYTRIDKIGHKLSYDGFKDAFKGMHECYDSCIKLLGDVLDNTETVLIQRDLQIDKLHEKIVKKDLELQQVEKLHSKTLVEVETELLDKVQIAKSKIEKLQRTFKQKLDGWMHTGRWE